MINSTVKDGIAILTIDMADRTMNVFSPELAKELRAAFDAQVSDAQVKGIVITSGKSSFVAGADLGQMADFAKAGIGAADALSGIALYGDLFRHIETCGKPVAAAANGLALGAGLELVLACHYRVAANEPAAQYGLPEVKLGLLPGAGGTQRVPRLMGIAASLALLTTGKSLTAAEAKAAGLVHEAAPASEVLSLAVQAILSGKVDPVAAWDKKGYTLPGGDAYSRANINALTAANASSHASTRGNLPAPLAILRCVYEGTVLPMDRALRLEQKHFVTLVQGSVAQNLIQTMFFAKQAADKLSRRPAEVPKSKVSKLGILGAGFMGAGIAQASATVGMQVVLVDRDLPTAQRGFDGIAAALTGDVEKGRLSAEARDTTLARISVAAEHKAFGDCDLVIEAVVEDEGVKAIVTKMAESNMKESGIYATNTSALPIDALAKASVRPQNFIGLHFFSPVPKMALVEVIVGSKTTPETLARSLDYIRQIKKTPIIVNDGYGFYTTRCVDSYVREGLRALLDGVDPVQIEAAGVALGMPVGPLALADEVGIDVLHHIAHFFRSNESGEWAEDRHGAVNALLDRVVEERRFGRKTGKGFYAYPKGAAKHLDSDFLTGFPKSEVQPGQADIRERLLFAQVLETARCWDENVITDADEANLGAVLGWAFPAYLGGPVAVLNQVGPAEFVSRCDHMTQVLGARFQVPARLRQLAASGKLLLAA